MSDSYLKSLKDRLKKLDSKMAEKQFYKWSYNYPDTDLESKGYKFTGNVKEV